MQFKTIITGRLEFASERSYRKAIELYAHRSEVYYKEDIALGVEEVFDEEQLALNIPRHVCQLSDKTWKNTVHLLKYIAQFALAGSIQAWRLNEDRSIRNQMLIEPVGDKQAVRSFMEGRQLLEKEGKEAEAAHALSQAIKIFDRHALAYERRAVANYRLGHLDLARKDYDRSLSINAGLAPSYLGRARLLMAEGDFAAAIPDLEQATSNSIPLQPRYWIARRLKGECHLALEEFDKAAVEYKLFTSRAFTERDPNRQALKKAFFDLGRALYAQEKYDAAVSALSKAAGRKSEDESFPGDGEVLVLRGLARQKAGSDDFRKDWKHAAERGSARAKKLLAEAAAV